MGIIIDINGVTILGEILCNGIGGIVSVGGPIQYQ